MIVDGQRRTDSRPRWSFARIISTLAVVSSVITAPVAATVAVQAVTAAPAAAAANLTCATNLTYVLNGTGAFYQANETTGALSAAAGNFGVGTLNGFGVGPNGADAFAVQQTASGAGAAKVYELTLSTGVVTTINVTAAANQALIAGAVNPVTGIFYYAGYTGTGAAATYDIYGVTAAGVSIGLVATGAAPNANTGDIAFDGAGNLYILAGATGTATVYSTTTALPTAATGTPVALTLKKLATLTGAGTYYGMSIDPNGFLYALNASTPSLTPVNTNTGALGTPVTLTGTGSTGLVDSGSCAFNGTVSVVKNIVARVASGDQFTVSVASGATTLDTGTTTGSTTGSQTAPAEVAGPVIGNLGVSYTASEAASGTTNLLDYASSYSCPDANNTGTSVTSTAIGTGSKTFTLAALGNFAVNQYVQIASSANSANYMYGQITAVNAATPSITVNVTAVGGSGTLASWNLTAIVAQGTGTTTTFTFPALDGSQGASITCTFTNSPALKVTKVASPTTVTAAGQTVTYTFTATNTGTTAMSGVGITDTQTAPAGSLNATPACTGLTNPTATCSGTTTTLAAGQTATFTATYTVTQADMNNGAIADSAVAYGTPTGGSQYNSLPATASVTATQTPGLTITKTPSPTSVSAVGSVVTYTFTVKNTGNVTLTGIVVNDTQTSPAGSLTSGPTCLATTLAPGISTTCTATYTTTQADLDNGSIADSATATGTPPSGTPYTTPIPGTANVTASQTPGLTIAKTANPTTVSAVGNVVTYTFTVKNTGNVDLTGIVVNDTQNSPAGSLTSGPTCLATSLAPGISTTCTATYTTAQADLDKGSITDSATATGTLPNATKYTTPIPATATVTATQTAGLTISKTANPTTVNAVGSLVTYTFTVKNTGNIDLTGIVVNDTQNSPAGSLTSGPTCLATSLAPGISTTCTATYTVAQADLNKGSITDSATATGTLPNSTTYTTPTPATATVTATQTAGLTISKTASPTTVSAVGNVVTYTFTVKNTGNVTLTTVGVNDTQNAPAGSLTSGPTCTSLTSPTATCTRYVHDTAAEPGRHLHRDLHHGPS